MKTLALILFSLTLAGCTMHHNPRSSLKPVQSGERVVLTETLRLTEDRGLSKVQWELLPGTYVERYRAPQGRVFVSQSGLVQFTPSMGGDQMRYFGGWIVLDDKPGMGRLYNIRGPNISPLLASLHGDAGDFYPHVDFDLGLLKTR